MIFAHSFASTTFDRNGRFRDKLLFISWRFFDEYYHLSSIIWYYGGNAAKGVHFSIFIALFDTFIVSTIETRESDQDRIKQSRYASSNKFHFHHSMLAYWWPSSAIMFILDRLNTIRKNGAFRLCLPEHPQDGRRRTMVIKIIDK
jgi:hypothetical protein